MRTLFGHVGLVSIISLTLAGCGQKTSVTPPPGPPPPAPPTPPAAGYNIKLAFGTTLTNADKAIFQAAAGRWEVIITNDLPDSNEPANATDCGDPTLTNFPTVNGVDDLVIFADVVPIDGPGGTLAQAGPCLTRSTGAQLPGTGIMQLDSADVAELRITNHLLETVTHEMGHVIGFGTIWKNKGGFLSGAGPDQGCGNAPTYIKSNAKAQYALLGGTGDVPIEGSTSGPGSCDSHWRESIFGTELMTPSIDTTSPDKNPLSRLTVAALADLGYEVDLTAADRFSLAGIGSLLPSSNRVTLREVLITPRGTLR
jgi:Leishmanolysin